MYFESFAQAWDMAGHGSYVWSAYALTFAIVIALVVLPVRRARETRRQIVAEQRRRRAQTEAAASAASEEFHAS